jgi:hypothetical protein
MSMAFRLGLSLGVAVAHLGQILTPPGKSKVQVGHMNPPQTLHWAVAGEFGCWTQRTPSGIGNREESGGGA